MKKNNNVTLMSDAEERNYWENRIKSVQDDPGYGEVLFIIEGQKVCAVIPTPLYNMNINKPNSKVSQSLKSMNDIKCFNFIHKLIKEIQESTGSGVIVVGIKDHKIHLVKATTIPGNYMYKIY
ncbi:MAG: hypothetical protein WCG45_02620 [bacterium]